MDIEQKARQLIDQAKECINKQDYNEAKKYLEQCLEQHKVAEAYHDLGVIYYMEGSLELAVSNLQLSVQTEPDYHVGYINLARIFFENGEKNKALEYCILATQAAPEEASYKDELVKIFRNQNFIMFHPEFKRVILDCLQTVNIDHDGLAVSWLSILKHDPAIGPLFSLGRKKNYKSFKKSFLKQKDYSGFKDPYFSLGLKRFMVPNLTFEKFITFVRRFLLELVLDGNSDLIKDDTFQDFTRALAEYCLSTHYVLGISDDEKQNVLDLHGQVSSWDDGLENPFAVFVLACYQPIFKLPNIEIVRGSISDDDFTKVHIDNPLQQESIKETISSLTGIKDGVSSEVREQYEEFPYPYWKSLTRINTFQEILDGWGAKRDNILVAGCGTGKEVLDMAAALPESNILAIDLSLSSLSYAIRNARELNIENVTFKHADILELENIDMEFDIITSMGVLHHLKDPMAGWRILEKKLKPGGYMAVALYSEIARRSIVNVRDLIAKKKYGSSAEEIRRFRADCPKVLKKNDFTYITEKLRDFYSLAECRDLLFHVQENRFTIPQINECLDDLKLEFIRFIVSPECENSYSSLFPNDSDKKDLNNWDNFEKKNPDAFKSMYTFWCHKSE